MTKLCAIHQPNFFPWLGYFDKMRMADVFVYLDAVTYPKKGSSSVGSWTNRVKVNVQGEARWVGCTLQKFSSGELIKNVEITDTQPWRKKMIKTLEMNYKKAPNFAEVMNILEPLILFENTNLADFNINAIASISRYLGVNVKTVQQSELNCEGASTELLANITRAVGCDAYICGGGAAGYQRDEVFERRGIQLIYQSYQPEVYGAPDAFLPGLSVIDFLMKRTQ